MRVKSPTTYKELIMSEANQDFVNTYLAINATKYPSESIGQISSILKSLNQNQATTLAGLNIKDPTLALLLSFFFGSFGVDRFYIGNIFLGILKLITIGGFGIWTIVDWFIIMKTTRKQNLMKLLSLGR